MALSRPYFCPQFLCLPLVNTPFHFQQQLLQISSTILRPHFCFYPAQYLGEPYLLFLRKLRFLQQCMEVPLATSAFTSHLRVQELLLLLWLSLPSVALIMCVPLWSRIFILQLCRYCLFASLSLSLSIYL